MPLLVSPSVAASASGMMPAAGRQQRRGDRLRPRVSAVAEREIAGAGRR